MIHKIKIWKQLADLPTWFKSVVIVVIVLNFVAIEQKSIEF